MIYNQDALLRSALGGFYNTSGERGAYQALTSWVFLVASAGAVMEIYVRQPLSADSLHLLACHPSSPAFMALCGGVDSRDGPAAAGVGEEGER